MLGGSSGSTGGSGGPLGGFIGKLIQGNICYDTTEAESLTGSTSIVDNLNHMRYRIATLEGQVATLEGYYVSQTFTSDDVISVEHNLGKYPMVIALAGKTYGWGNFWGSLPWGGVTTGYEVLTPSSIDHMNINQVIVTLSSSETGYIVCIA